MLREGEQQTDTHTHTRAHTPRKRQTLLANGKNQMTESRALFDRGTLPAGSSGAIAYEIWAGPIRPPAHRYVMGAFSCGFFAMGVYRALMYDESSPTKA